jgi:hypothetical protein
MSETTNYLSLSIKLILILSIINGVYNHLWHMASTHIFLLILMFVPQIIKSKYDIKFPKIFEWSLLIFVIITLLLGSIGGIIVSIFFGISISFVGFMILAILYSANQIKKNYFLIILFSFNFSVAFGVAIELVKYYLKLILKYPLSVSNLAYSMETLTFVVIGAIISSIIGYLYMRYPKGILREAFKSVTEKNPALFKKTEVLKEEIFELIKKGENENLEFKSTFRTNLHTNEIDRKIEYSALKTIAAFLNSKGGALLIGINDSKEIIGIEKDNFTSSDKLSLHITNLIKTRLGKNSLSFIKLKFIDVDGKIILKIECEKSKSPVFLKTQENEEEFYIRAGPSSTQIKGSELLEYIEKNFKNKKD